jgi:predicted RNase H-like HicB family nuclease
MAKVTYRVVVTREGPAWLAEVPELPGTHTWAKNLPALDAAVREVIALALDLPEGPEAEAALDLAYEYHVGDPKLDDEAAGLRHAREELRREQERLAAASDRLVRELIKKRLPVRDVGLLTGMSPQRVSQITGTARSAAHKPRARSRKGGRGGEVTAEREERQGGG